MFDWCRTEAILRVHRQTGCTTPGAYLTLSTGMGPDGLIKSFHAGAVRIHKHLSASDCSTITSKVTWVIKASA